MFFKKARGEKILKRSSNHIVKRDMNKKKIKFYQRLFFHQVLFFHDLKQSDEDNLYFLTAYSSMGSVLFTTKKATLHVRTLTFSPLRNLLPLQWETHQMP